MKKLIVLMSMAVMLLSVGVAKAAPDFDFYNNLPISVCYLYISPSTASDWEEDILGPCIDPYDWVRVVIKGVSAPSWDIRWQDENGGEGTAYGVNLSQYSLVYLDSDRNLLFE